MIFNSQLWQVSVTPPWKVLQTEDCVEINQPEGTGALHISGFSKQGGGVTDLETIEFIRDDVPADTETSSVRLGDFIGYHAEYTDSNENIFFKKWFLGCRNVLLFITYNCRQGDENLELAEIETILKSLRCKA